MDPRDVKRIKNNSDYPTISSIKQCTETARKCCSWGGLGSMPPAGGTAAILCMDSEEFGGLIQRDGNQSQIKWITPVPMMWIYNGY
jgi:hypothetical protein